MTIQTKEICHRDIMGNVIIVPPNTTPEYMGLCDNNVHWGWYLFWLIVFIPMIAVLLLMDFMKNNHLVKVNGVVYEVDKYTLKRIVGGE